MIEWNMNPEIFKLGFVAPRWYGLMFFLGFSLGYLYVGYFLKKIGKNNDHLSSLLNHIFLGTLIGARLGHCFFYEPIYFLQNPFEILQFWKGGLASHGGYIGITITTLLFLKKNRDIKFFWLADLLAAPAILTGSFIRLGNLFNSEILGTQTDVAWSFIFTHIDNIPRHPTALYEFLGYFSVAIILYLLRFKYVEKWKTGIILSIAMILSFTFRFFIEYFKEVQVSFENSMFINMGQILSLPLILLGFYLLYKRIKTT